MSAKKTGIYAVLVVVATTRTKTGVEKIGRNLLGVDNVENVSGRHVQALTVNLTDNKL